MLYFDIVFEAVNSVKEFIKLTADTATRGMQYEANLFGYDMPILIRKLEEIIPPCEIEDGKPANIISILNSGMVHKMSWNSNTNSELTDKKNVEETERNINSLGLRSIEMSILQEQMLYYLRE